MRIKKNKMIVCKDGFTMSVQANKGAYCEPRVNNAKKYTSVEIGYPSQHEEMLMEWCEDSDKPLNTVYGWVPAERVSLIRAKHGGVVSGELPAGIPFIEAI